MTDVVCTLKCPDCGTVCAVRFALLVEGSRIVALTTCARCADHATIRGFQELSTLEFLEALADHLPVVHYGRRSNAP